MRLQLVFVSLWCLPLSRLRAPLPRACVCSVQEWSACLIGASLGAACAPDQQVRLAVMCIRPVRVPDQCGHPVDMCIGVVCASGRGVRLAGVF